MKQTPLSKYLFMVLERRAMEFTDRRVAFNRAEAVAWDSHEEERLMKMVNEGRSLREISSQMPHRSTSSIRNKVLLLKGVKQGC